jgi:hypothetical protein
MNDRAPTLPPLQLVLARKVLFRSEQGPTHLPPLGELARRHGTTPAQVREALQLLIAFGLVELRGGRGPWLPPLALRRGLETIGLELACARTPAERLRPLDSWLQMEHELTVESYRRCSRARPEARERVARALDQIVSAAFMDAPREALALYRWRATGAAVEGARCEPLRLLGNTLGRSVERVLPVLSLALEPRELAEEMIEVQDHLLRRRPDDLAAFLDLSTRRLHAQVVELAREQTLLRPRRKVHAIRALRRAG